MGMTYEELSVFGRLRKVARQGPWTMFEKLVHLWSLPPPSGEIATERTEAIHQKAQAVHAIHGRGLTPREVMEKVARFWHFHYINRRKMNGSDSFPTMLKHIHPEESSECLAVSDSVCWFEVRQV